MVLYGACNAGIGQLLSSMTSSEFTNYQKVRRLLAVESRIMLMEIQHLFFVVIVAHLAMGVVKISVLSFYKRIFAIRSFRRAANVTMGFVILWILGSFFVSIASISHQSYLILLDADLFSMADIQLVELPRGIYYQLRCILNSFRSDGYLT